MKAFRFDLSRDIESEVKRVALAQVTAAVDALSAAGVESTEAVHEFRTRCKKLRALVRLVRPALGEPTYDDANALFRAAARQLSDLRDAQVLSATFEQLRERSDPEDADELLAVQDGLDRQAEKVSRHIDGAQARAAGALRMMRAGEDSIDHWSLDDEGFDALGPGLAATYARGRLALDDALDRPDAKRLHEYRKQVKYSWYHLRLVRDIAPAVTRPLTKEFSALADLLGEVNDLSVLRATLREGTDDLGGKRATRAALVVVDGRRAELERRALVLGAQLHAEKAKAFEKRFAAYWRARIETVGLTAGKG